MRYVLAALALVLLVGALVTVKYKQISQLIGFGKEMQKSGPPPEAVGSATSREQTWAATLTAVGTIAAVKGVSISNEVPGIVSAIHFESGAAVRQGQVLVEMNSSVERAQLASIEARRDLAMINAGRSKELVSTQTIAQSQLDTDESAVRTSRADLGALKAQIDRKVVRAPFTGRLGIRQVNLGQYLTPGVSLVTLDAIDSVFVDFTLPQQELGSLAVGMPVHITVDGADGLAADGKILAIDPTIDSTTRTIKIRATVPNKDEKLRPGMFANASVGLPQNAKVVVVPTPSVVHASYGDSVFVLEDKKDEAGAQVMSAAGKPVRTAHQQFVRTGETRGDFITIVEGLKADQEVVTAGAFKLRNGAGVVVDNDIKSTAPQLSPHPENR